MKFNLSGSLLFLSMFIFLLTSCGNFEDIKIGEPKEAKLRGFEDNFLVVDVALPVNNPTMYRVTIKEMDVRVFLNNRYMGKLIIDEKIVIKPNHDTVYQLPVKIRLANVLGTAFVMMNLKKGQASEVRFEGKIRAKALLLISKTIEINETKMINF